MANQTGVAKAKETVSSVSIHHDPQQLQERLQDNVARRAYKLYLEGGRREGNDFANWLQAESEIFSKVPEIRELSSWFTVSVPVAGFAPDDVHVATDHSRAIVVGDHQHAGSDGGSTSRDSLFVIADWPLPVDPATATAYIKNEALILTVKRAREPDERSTS
jgi:HSP20 family molecular chaperone IbpA